ncbi:leucine-rich PPR motif-containing protein, mitochondrial [Alosa sapidissima]|uniref:leucine-rich PPR motif-containing protein, mitochondrial n=1 Tax=Alosa sapidissima TaxID=34773 RepID=UPI001C095CB4|nr:leucine-rich PPR motif-containing protein, mitochondrial [Alosa sapidissima]
MAALLRSARVLKLSPSSLLQVVGVTKHGAPLRRLFSGAIGGRGIGLCTSQGVSRSVSVNRSWSSCRLLWPSAAGVRRYAAVPEQQGKEEGSVGLRSKQAQQFDWALAKLDSSVRRTGRITKTLLLRIFHDICRSGYPSGNQALLLLRSCGSLLPEAPFTERTELAHRIWDKLQELGASYDASHYNALLKVYLQNEHKFSPTEFLAKMEGANVQPNRVTYQRLIAAYCQEGDIEGASKILGFMKGKDLPITEAVFNSLVTGHARAGDMESAESILNVMKGAGIEPGPDTFVALMTAYAEKGDIEKIKQTLETAEGSDASLMDRDLMQAVFSLARAGHAQHVPVIVERMRHERGYVPDAMNLCLSLITQGQEDTAYTVLKTFPRLQEEGQSGETPDLGNFFLRHCINMDKPVEKLAHYCRDLNDSGLHASPMQFALYCALEAKKTGLAVELMKVMKDEGLPVRPHYFWPLLTHHQREKNTPVPVSSPSFPSVDLSTFRSSLISGFRRSNDVESMAKVTELLYQDKRFCPPPHEPKEYVAYFLYNLIDGMGSSEVQANEDTLRKYFTQLKSLNISIPVTVYRGIRNLLDSYHVPELIKDVIILVDNKESVGFMEMRVPKGVEGKLAMLEGRLSELKAEGKPVNTILKQLIQTLCTEEKLDRALELKTQNEEHMAIGGYAALINLCCRHDNVDEAMNLKREISRKDSSVALDSNKYMTLVRSLAKHGRLEEAVALLKEMKEKDVSLKDSSSVLLFHTLNAAALKGEVDTIRQLQDTAFTLGLAKPTANLCSPLITVYLESYSAMSRIPEFKLSDMASSLLLITHAKRDQVKDAKDIMQSMLQADQVPSQLAITRLVQAMGSHGDLQGIQEVEEKVKSIGATLNLSAMVFINNTALAHIKNGDIESAVETLENVYTQGGDTNRAISISFVFRKVLEQKNDQALDKLAAMAERLANHFASYRAATDLFLQYLDSGLNEEAKFMLARCNAIAEQKDFLLSYVARTSQQPGEVKKITALAEMIPDFTDKETLYSYLMKSYGVDKDLASAKSLYERVQMEGLQMDELFMKRLALLYREAGEATPFQEPPESFKFYANKLREKTKGQIESGDD